METITINNKEIEYEISYKAKRNINIRIESDSKIKVSAPRRVSKAEIRKVISEKASWILKNLEKQKGIKKNKLEAGNLIWYKGRQYMLYYKQADKNNVIVFEDYILVYSKHVDDLEYSKGVLQNWLKKNAEVEFKYVLNNFYSQMITKYKIPEYTFQIRNMKTRWGTCMPTEKKITLSLNLMYVPHPYLEYVALHELTHFLEIHHNSHFYSIVGEFMPDYKERQKNLNKEYSFISE